MPGGPEGAPQGLYNEHGQVEDPEIARRMAIEEKEDDEYGAEKLGAKLQAEKETTESLRGFSIQDTDFGWKVAGVLKGHQITFELQVRPYTKNAWVGLKGCEVDGTSLDSASMNEMYSKFFTPIENRFADEISEENIRAKQEKYNKALENSENQTRQAVEKSISDLL